MGKKGVLLHNRQAGNAAEDSLLEELQEVIRTEVDTLEVFTGETAEETLLFLRNDEHLMDKLWVLGGDGTVHLAVEGIRTRKSIPEVAVLPAGTCNDTARSLQLPLKPLEACKASIGKEPVLLDAGLCGDEAFINFAGLGLIADTSENIDPDLKEKTGRVSYFVSAWQTMKEAQPFSYSMEVDGEHYRGEAIMILAANGGFLGTSELPSETISMTDGKLDLFIVKMGGRSVFGEWLQQKLTSTSIEDAENVTWLQGSSIMLDTDPPKKLDLDGELREAGTVEISILKQRIPFITGW
ncbi:diacylglycerol/lipid kinase family protein [Alkalicoccus luteus]|uniref:Diacylglycerol kinase family lipid kinase n=1 Tax=Alkalicoccus luteus TaxID=1237094 RepID=A0A969PQX3_9BACI|nr:diacylglycerol kinase family protein [Alkalicoccus luteus]NJP38742.1 diacylglycerol kinase family lipid kinase [Alkalicoccus luteus]